MGTKEYTSEYKKEAVKLAKEVGAKQAATELGVPKGTLYCLGMTRNWFLTPVNIYKLNILCCIMGWGKVYLNSG